MIRDDECPRLASALPFNDEVPRVRLDCFDVTHGVSARFRLVPDENVLIHVQLLVVLQVEFNEQVVAGSHHRAHGYFTARPLGGFLSGPGLGAALRFAVDQCVSGDRMVD